MPAPTVTLPTTGTDPKVATKTDLQDEINAALEANYDNIEAHKATMGDLATQDTVSGYQINDEQVYNSKLSHIAQYALKGRASSGVGPVESVYLSAILGPVVEAATEKTEIFWNDAFLLADAEDSFTMKETRAMYLRDYMAGALAATFQAKANSYTVATVPSAKTSGAGAQIFVSDETGGSVVAFSDGWNWRRCTDRTIITT